MEMRPPTCGRGKMEKDVGEFKTECFGGRASTSRFHTNSLRMILARFCQMLTKVIRVFLFRGLRHERPEEKMMTLRKFRKHLIEVPAQITELENRIVLTLPEFMLDNRAFLYLFNLRIR